MKAIGLCVGASTITYVQLERFGTETRIMASKSLSHGGNPREVLVSMISEEMLAGCDRLAATGRKFRNLLNTSSIAEVEAVEYAYAFERPSSGDADTIVSAGGETFLAYRLDPKGRVIDVRTGNKCASGTGEFFLQQIKRMNLSVEQAVETADVNDSYRVSGRCSVFCKSDCTHALNKGTPKPTVVAGLCEMMALKIVELLRNVDHHGVVLTGGVSLNTAVEHFLRDKFSDLRVSQYATIYEALGAGLWALDHPTNAITDPEQLFKNDHLSVGFLAPLSDYVNMVTFKQAVRQQGRPGDTCILGLDVGSTTTKAVLLRESDDAIIASCYLRTNGDPIGASRRCYAALLEQAPYGVRIRGLGTTGSGRQIAGLHALTPAVINEIIAHAAAAVHFDPEVDTIFEIGGQDAKYTYITAGVPSDYAMNEACSAGTGSFIEEAARESLNMPVEDIGPFALKATRAPDFSDQCAAFINSDIKAAIQEGIELPAIAAGVVYSICMNYSNRVKGSRAVGKKVFMQGGVCYNPAVPVAMAALTGKNIVVPPEPGLMGAFGVALEVKKRLSLSILEPGDFNLGELVKREVVYGEPFICAGGAEKCDRKCSINRIKIDSKVYPFGGACNRYTNLLYGAHIEEGQDLVQLRERLVFEEFGARRARQLASPNGKTIGIIPSLLTTTLYPLYMNFFTAIGFKVVLADEVIEAGLERKGAAFCYPAEISHGYLQGLCDKNPDIYFLPHVKSMPLDEEIEQNQVCPFVQGEPYFLKAAFPEMPRKRIVSPVLKFHRGYEAARPQFLALAKKLGVDEKLAGEAYTLAVAAQDEMRREFLRLGREALEQVARNPGEVAIVLFGRPYNALSRRGNMGIPHKFSSRGYRIIPFDFLPKTGAPKPNNMYWPLGRAILDNAYAVRRNPQLFPVYVTNFSCGPDSFLLSYFRYRMGDKPSLTLEIDSHTADVGLDTRIEAFLDVVKNYVEIEKRQPAEQAAEGFSPATVRISDGKLEILDSSGKKYAITDPHVKVVIPSMGDFMTRAGAAALRASGVKTEALPEPDALDLKAGQGVSTCKECLPLLLTVGSILRYIDNGVDSGQMTLFFMPKTCGPCRFGQYNVFIEQIIEQRKLPNMAVLSLSDDTGYAGLGSGLALKIWQAMVIADTMEDIRAAIQALAVDVDEALSVYEQVSGHILYALQKESWPVVCATLRDVARTLSKIPLKRPLHEAPSAGLIGEIYVRRDEFSRQGMVARLAAKGIVVHIAPIAEWIYYTDSIIRRVEVSGATFGTRMMNSIEGLFKKRYEKQIKSILSRSGLYSMHIIDVDKTIDKVAHLISPHLEGEAILTAGMAITSIIEEVDGVIALGPFGCMPSRIAEAVASTSIALARLDTASNRPLVERVLGEYPSLPFLALETDGNRMTQSVEAKIEAFCLQVQRVHAESSRTLEPSLGAARQHR